MPVLNNSLVHEGSEVLACKNVLCFCFLFGFFSPDYQQILTTKGWEVKCGGSLQYGTDRCKPWSQDLFFLRLYPWVFLSLKKKTNHKLGRSDVRNLKISLDLCLYYGLELSELASYKGRFIYQLHRNSSCINLQLAPKMHSALLTCIVVNICQHPRWQPCYHSQDERNVNVIS